MGTVKIMESIYAKNESAAGDINAALTGRGVFAVNVIGSPGAGKTTALLNIIPLLNKPSYVIEGDIESDIDAERLAAAGVPAVQINTGGACHLDAPMVERAVDSLNPGGGFLFIENIGNLVCPAEFLIGEHVKLVVSSTAEGADKPYKYPLAFEKADAVLVSKSDLAQYVDFDFGYFAAGVRKLNGKAPIFSVSSKDGGAGFREAACWIAAEAERRFGL